MQLHTLQRRIHALLAAFGFSLNAAPAVGAAHDDDVYDIESQEKKGQRLLNDAALPLVPLADENAVVTGDFDVRSRQMPVSFARRVLPKYPNFDAKQGGGGDEATIREESFDSIMERNSAPLRAYWRKMRRLRDPLALFSALFLQVYERDAVGTIVTDKTKDVAMRATPLYNAGRAWATLLAEHVVNDATADADAIDAADVVATAVFGKTTTPESDGGNAGDGGGVGGGLVVFIALAAAAAGAISGIVLYRLGTRKQNTSRDGRGDSVYDLATV
jgi:hypothetical protein